MQEFFGSIWWLLISLGILVTFHEFGHFWVARRFGVRVLRFSVGFGKPLWRRVGRDGTEYVIAALPLGGYVKMLDEREAEVPLAELDQAFNRKPVSQRFAIVAAGPLFNLLLCLLLLWGMFMVGKNDFLPLVGRSDGIAAEAGIRAGDRLVSIDGKGVETWTHAAMALTGLALDRVAVPLEVVGADGGTRHLRLDLAQLADGLDENTALRDIGVVPKQILVPAEIGTVRPDSPAARAGLEDGDRILAIAGTAIEYWDEVPRLLQEHGSASAPVDLRIERDGQPLEVAVRPEPQTFASGTRWIVGIEPPRVEPAHDALLQYGPVDAAGAAVRETWRLTETTFGMLYRMVVGTASLQNISGPITIAQVANSSAQLGVAWFLFFLAVLSLSLCIMNLLPIPILDGGHLVYYLIEMIKGSPVSERVLIMGQYVGLAMLACLMGLAFYNDILRLVSS